MRQKFVGNCREKYGDSLYCKLLNFYVGWLHLTTCIKRICYELDLLRPVLLIIRNMNSRNKNHVLWNMVSAS